MENRRSWPWRKKSSSDRHSHSTDSEAGSPAPSPARSMRHYDEQDIVKVTADVPRQSDDAVVQWHQCEEKAKGLTERLTAALADITAKDNLVKQHAKVAEEAVTGWEKAEAEALTLKQQLESVQQQKLATEDRVSHLDGALKECMRQLRHVREEQETKVHETVVKKTREFDKQRSELETKRSELETKLSELGRQLVESSAQNAAMNAALQERAKSISELSNGKSTAEAEIRVLQVRVETVEKENAALKYEVHVLGKEIEIRNEERDYSKKAADIANKQQLENVKKVAKLEAECQRLRLLVRKRLPGPAALAQMKAEVESLGRDPGEVRRRKSLGPRSPHSPGAFQHHHDHENGQDLESLSERLTGLEDENTMLKEALSRRNEELHSARIMCARTATKLSTAEDQMDTFRTTKGLPSASAADTLSSLDFGRSLPPSRSSTVIDRGSSRASNSGDSVAEEELNNADAWASALVAELAQFRKDKGDTKKEKRNGSVSSINFDIMDDFAEMERLAGLTPTKNIEEVAESDAASDKNALAAEMMAFAAEEEKASLEEALAKKGQDLQAAMQMNKDVSEKLSTAEEQLSALQTRNAANEKQLICLQERLDLIFEAQAEGANMAEVLKEVRQAAAADSNGKGFGILMKGGPMGVRELGYWAHNSVYEAGLEGGKIGADLGAVVKKIVALVESLAETTGVAFDTISQPAGAQSEHANVQSCKYWKDSGLQSCVANVIMVTNNLLQGKTDVTAFLTGLAAALGVIADLGADTKVVSQLEEELRNVRQEKAAVESHMRAEMGRFSGLELEIRQLRLDRDGMERCLTESNDRAESLKAQLLEAEQLLRGHKEALTENQRSEDELLEDELMTLSASKADLLETRVKAADVEMNRLHDKVAALEVELQGERMRHQEVMAKFQEIQEHLHGNGALSDSSGRRPRDLERANLRRAEEEEARSRKDREIAAAAQQLAECQRTILLLGKQLKTLSSPGHSGEASTLESSSDSASSLEKPSRNMELLRSQADDVVSSNNTQNGHYRESPTHQLGVGGFASTPKRKSGTEIPWNSCISPQGSSISTGSYASETESKAEQNGHENGGQHAAPQSQYGTPQGKCPDSYSSRDNGYHTRAGSAGSHPFTPDRTPFSLPSSPSPSDSASLSSPSKSPATVLPSKLRVSSLNGRGNGSLSKSMDSAENGTNSHDHRSNGSGSSTFSRFYSRMRSTSSVS